MDKKIAVLATGTNGCVISADLIGAGLDVTMIDMWAAHIEEMRANGLTVTTGLIGKTPVGVQLIGGRYQEDVLLRAVEDIERAGTPASPVDPITA